MARKNAKPKRLRLRPTDGLLENVEVSLPVAWAATLRSRADKLTMSLDALLVQYAGHLAAELDALGEAVASPTLGDDVARFRLRGAFLKTFEAKSVRSGIPVNALIHRSLSDTASAFAGRAREPLPKPIVMAPGQKKLGRR